MSLRSKIKNQKDLILILEGGSMRGLSSVAILKALKDSNINFKSTIGVSSGAINALYFNTNQLDDLKNIYLDLCQFKKISFKTKHIIKNIKPNYFLVNNALNKYPLNGFDNKDIRIAVADYYTHQLIGLKANKENLKTQLLATTQMPFINNKPIYYQNHYYVDGGILDPIPYKIFTNSLNYKDYFPIIIHTYPLHLKSENKKSVSKNVYNYLNKKTMPNIANHFDKFHQYRQDTVDQLINLEYENKVINLAPSVDSYIEPYELNEEILLNKYQNIYQETIKYLNLDNKIFKKIT